MKSVCFFHDDMDGICSAAIVKRCHCYDCEFVEVKYGMTLEEQRELIKKYDTSWRVIVVDFSFDAEIMKQLADETGAFCWIDHHASAANRLKKLWNSKGIEGKRSIQSAACELTWLWFNPPDDFPDRPVPRCVQLIGDWDMWKFKYGDETRAFHEAAWLELNNPETDEWHWLLDGESDANRWDALMEKGFALLQAKQARVRKAFENGEDCDFFGHRARVCNSSVDISDIGNYAVEQGYDIGVIWKYKSRRFEISLRSKGDLDVSKLAEKFKGGGHKNAAGFSVNWTEFDVLVRPHLTLPSTEEVA